MTTLICLFEKVYSLKYKSAWRKGVQKYACEILKKLNENGFIYTDFTEKDALNGAQDWKQYSYGGCSLCYDVDIAKRLFNKDLTTTESLNKRRKKLHNPNKEKDYLADQAKALWQAWELIERVRNGKENEKKGE